MYKVYINDKPILLSNQMISYSEYEIYLFKNIRIEEVIHKLQNTLISGIYLYHPDLDELWTRFKQHFAMVQAAGGLVKNRQNEYLFIKRNEHWDLPKGKIEDNETTEFAAIREVEEECNISQLKIEEALPVTYHIYQEHGAYKLKKTYWYLMKTEDINQPIPQIEEGIVETTYLKKEQIKEHFPQMYANIKDLVSEYFNLL